VITDCSFVTSQFLLSIDHCPSSLSLAASSCRFPPTAPPSPRERFLRQHVSFAPGFRKAVKPLFRPARAPRVSKERRGCAGRKTSGLVFRGMPRIPRSAPRLSRRRPGVPVGSAWRNRPAPASACGVWDGPKGEACVIASGRRAVRSCQPRRAPGRSRRDGGALDASPRFDANLPSPACERGWQGEAEPGEGNSLLTRNKLEYRRSPFTPDPSPVNGKGEKKDSRLTHGSTEQARKGEGQHAAIEAI
jgi:hypothetical protein